jgi:ribosome-binding factor A
MNDIRKLRLQNQIFRHVATYYQKMSRGQNVTMSLDTPVDVDKTPEGGAVKDAGEVKNPFETLDPARFTEQVNDYCTFTRCELSPDGSFAKIFVSIWGDAKEQERIMKDIKRHAHGMRSSIAKHIRMRAIPQLAFIQDHSFEKASQIDKLI